MAGIDWLIVLVLNGGVVVYGIYLARGIKTSGEWFLGNRALTWWVVGLSIFATSIDNADLVSLTGITYREGMHIITAHTFGAAVGGILAGFYIVPVIYRRGLYTNAEYLETRFGVSTRVLSALIQIQYRTSMLGLMIWSIYLLLTGLVGLSSSHAWILIVLMVILTATYTAMGGLKSVAMTDALQGLVMLTGMLVIFVAVWNATGGWTNMLTMLDTVSDSGSVRATDLPHIGRYHGDHGSTPSFAVILGWIIIACGYWTVNHTQTMRLLGLRSIWDMKMAVLFGVFLGVPVMVGCSALGVFGRALYPNFAQPDQLYPLMANQYLGIGLKGLVVAGILAAAISTFDSIGSALSAVFTRDIYARLLNRGRDEAHYLNVSRWATVAILALGFSYIPFISSKDTMLIALLTLIPVFVTPLFTLYLFGVFTDVHQRSGLVGIVSGALYGLLALYDREISDVSWLAPWFTGRFEALSWSMLLTGLAMVVTTMIFGRHNEYELKTPDSGDWLHMSREELPSPKEHPFPVAVPGWLRPEWLALALIGFTAYLVFGFFW